MKFTKKLKTTVLLSLGEEIIKDNQKIIYEVVQFNDSDPMLNIQVWWLNSETNKWQFGKRPALNYYNLQWIRENRILEKAEDAMVEWYEKNGTN